jgi:drug/metabolite transporter (DMT)-like permease
MLWVSLAIFAHFCWAIVNIGDKYFVTNRLKDPLVFLWWTFLFGATFVVSIPFVHFFVPPAGQLAWLVVAGACYFFGSIFYVKAVAIEEITRINIWWGMIPVFTLAMAWLAIGERLNAAQIFAFGLLIGGALIASLRFGIQKFVIARAFWLMACAGVLYAGYGVIFRSLTQELSFLVAFIWSNIFTTLLAFSFFASKKFRRSFRSPGNAVHGELGRKIFALSLVDSLGVLFNVWALSLGPAALVFAMEGFQALFVFGLAIVISVKNPLLLREELDRRNVALKIIALVFMMAGIAVMNLF